MMIYFKLLTDFNWFKGKLDQMNNQLEIDFVIGRDVTDQNIDDILGVLDDW